MALELQTCVLTAYPTSPLRCATPQTAGLLFLRLLKSSLHLELVTPSFDLLRFKVSRGSSLHAVSNPSAIPKTLPLNPTRPAVTALLRDTVVSGLD